MTPRDMVAEFIEKFDASKEPALWGKLMREEAKEVHEAFLNLIKEMSDFIYVTYGAEIVKTTEEQFSDMGLDVDYYIIRAKCILQVMSHVIAPKEMKEAFKRVHASNMSKLGDDGKPIRRADGKILKGPNYKPADLSDLV